MPRTMRPKLVETSADGEPLFKGAGDVADGHRQSPPAGRAEGRADPSDSPGGGRAATWALSEAETLVWRGAAADACAQLRVDKRGVISGSDPGWTFPEQFRREPRQSVRQAMKVAGCSVERWSEATDVGGQLGGAWGGSGLQRVARRTM